MELREALTQISEIRAQMARGQVFRGYRSATAAFSGVVAVVAAVLQEMFVPEPGHEMLAYVGLWGGAAVLNMAVTGAEMWLRSRRSDSRLQGQLTLLVVEQFMPSVVAGGLLTATCVAYAPALFWAIPGLWMVLFSLGVFASCRLLPRATFLVGGFYLLCGVLYFVLAERWALSPWTMGLGFGVGQFLTAGILYVALERGHERA